MFCDYCKKTNHLADNCYKKINDNAKNEEKRKENNAGNKANIKPYPKPNINVVEKNEALVIRELNHSNRIYNTPPEDLSFATSTISVHGVEVEAMFDSGAIFSILRLVLVKKYKLPFDPIPTMCSMDNKNSHMKKPLLRLYFIDLQAKFCSSF